MQSNLNPLSERANSPIELARSSSKIVMPAEDTSVKPMNAPLFVTRDRVKEALSGVFAGLNRAQVTASFAGHHVSAGLTMGAIFARITKVVQGEYQSLTEQLMEQRRRNKMKRHWSTLQAKFQALYQAVAQANKARKVFSAKQDVSKMQTSSSRP